MGEERDRVGEREESQREAHARSEDSLLFSVRRRLSVTECLRKK